MVSKGFILALVALVACQGFVQAGRVPPRASNKGLQEDAIAAIEELKVILQQAIDEAKAQLAQLLADVQALADSLIASGLEALQAEVNKVLAEIEALRQQAAELGENIEGCIGDQEDAIKQLPLTLGNELIQCVTDQVNEAIRIVSDTVGAIEGTWDVVTSLEADLESCGGDFFCLGAVIAEAGLHVVELPIKIAEQVVAAEEFVATIQLDMEVCVTSKVAQIALEAGIILANIVQCVTDLLPK